VNLARDAGAPRQIARGEVHQSEGLGDRRLDERRIRNGGQRHEDHPGCALVRDRSCKLQRQACLPDSSWADERDEASGGSASQQSTSGNHAWNPAISVGEMRSDFQSARSTDAHALHAVEQAGTVSVIYASKKFEPPAVGWRMMRPINRGQAGNRG
jgi:hypothetical protein